MKTVGTFELWVLGPFIDPVYASDSPPSIQSLWLGLAVMIGCTALLYIIF